MPLELLNKGTKLFGNSQLNWSVKVIPLQAFATGAIFEVAAPEGINMGSIGGGGRYDNLTGIFGLNNVSGVGISFGLDRIYLVLEQLQLFPIEVAKNSSALFLNFGETEACYALEAIKQMRRSGIAVEFYPDEVKTGKQIQYAEKKGIPYVVFCGDREIADNSYTIKELQTGIQEQISLDDLITKLSN